MIQAGITRSVPAEDPATSQAELARLRAEYEAELGVWRGKYQQAEVDRENSSSFEKVELLISRAPSCGSLLARLTNYTRI